MSRHFNALTPAQAERLALLAEECGEVVHIIGKVLRHGFDSRDPTIDGAPRNHRLLARELGDLSYATKLLIDAGDILAEEIRMGESAAATHKPEWLHHQKPTP